jgi:ribosomal protein S12 methylthiotransferase accessory factor YcaO
LYALGVCDTPFAGVVPYWKAQFGRQCVSEVVADILTARPPKYSVILELDRKIRDMGFPKYALDPPTDGAPFPVVMQHLMPENYRCLGAC